ncbi:hypothetical protein DERF_007813 [Dermatophagoides farinae]|uniref:Uncharacterized protein n=1 Tax=Dermatophagoides farinae TaxID=6954 RepID=A0A922I147_DERFA|nr:hypothetical protein DERF_007813 [Dermatophagoides farinae]
MKMKKKKKMVELYRPQILFKCQPPPPPPQQQQHCIYYYITGFWPT